MTRRSLLIFGAVTVAAAVLAGLAYLSLRQWEASAALLLREQARDMAVMAAEKVEMTVLKSEEECLGALQMLLLDPSFRGEMLVAWVAKTALVERAYLFDRGGRLIFPAILPAADAAVASGLLADISPGF